MNTKFNMIKNFFDNGTWSIERVINAVKKNVISPDDFKKITGQNYKETK